VASMKDVVTIADAIARRRLPAGREQHA